MKPVTWFFVGALAGSATAGLAGLAATVAPTYLGIAVAILWGVPAMILVLADTAAALRANIPQPGPVVVEPDPDPVDEPAPAAGQTIYFNAAPSPAGTAPGSIFRGYAWPRWMDGPGPQPPQPPATAATMPPYSSPNGHAPAQPPAQPVAQPPRNRASLADQLADFPGLADYDPAAPRPPAPWERTPIPAAGDDDDPPAAPLLPRRRPIAEDYPLIWATLSGRSMNAAIRAIWGSKDAKTWAWLQLVGAYYADYHQYPIWLYELIVGDDDDPAAVVARLGLDHDDDHIRAELRRYHIARCAGCGRYYESTDDDLDAGVVTCTACQER